MDDADPAIETLREESASSTFFFFYLDQRVLREGVRGKRREQKGVERSREECCRERKVDERKKLVM